eukprot:scaffold117693_cov17-Tisochrysis_lutea.AAC.2
MSDTGKTRQYEVLHLGLHKSQDVCSLQGQCSIQAVPNAAPLPLSSQALEGVYEAIGIPLWSLLMLSFPSNPQAQVLLQGWPTT